MATFAFGLRTSSITSNHDVLLVNEENLKVKLVTWCDDKAKCFPECVQTNGAESRTVAKYVFVSGRCECYLLEDSNTGDPKVSLNDYTLTDKSAVAVFYFPSKFA